MAGSPTTAGSPALLAARPPDAFIVSRLRAAGAIILAKANLSEWANFRSTRSTSGWSTLGGQTANPYALDRNPSGSSSGSAAGLSAGFAPLAVGTETDGSIVSPSSACGVVGIKPTLGLVSRAGIVPLSLAQDTAGPMATSVADAAALLSVLAAADPPDSAIDHPRLHRLPAFLDPAALEGARIGVWRAASAGADAATEALLDGAVDCLRALGATVIDPVDLPDIDKVTEPEFDALNYEFKHGINAYLKYLAAFAGDSDLELPGTLAELIEYNERNAPLVLARFGQEIFLAARGDQRRPGRPGLPGVARRGAHPGADGGGDADARAQPGRDLLADRQPGLADRLRPRRPLGLRHLTAGSGVRLADDHRPVRLRLRASRSASRSSAPAGASPACSRSPTPSSRGRNPAARPPCFRQLPRTPLVSVCICICKRKCL